MVLFKILFPKDDSRFTFSKGLIYFSSLQIVGPTSMPIFYEVRTCSDAKMQSLLYKKRK